MRRLKKLPAGGRILVMDETTLRHLPPLRAAWSRRGEQARVPITGQNARRSLFGALDLKSGRRVFMARAHQRLADFHAFLRRLRAGAGRVGALWLLLDNHGSHKSPSSAKLAAKLGIALFWLPKQCPELNPVDHLWGSLKNTLAANRQFAAIDEQVRHALAWLHRLSPTQTLRKAGLLSPRCWLREVRKAICSPNYTRLPDPGTECPELSPARDLPLGGCGEHPPCDLILIRVTLTAVLPTSYPLNGAAGLTRAALDFPRYCSFAVWCPNMDSWNEVVRVF